MIASVCTEIIIMLMDVRIGREWSNLAHAFQFGSLPDSRFCPWPYWSCLCRARALAGVGYGWYICEASWNEVLKWLPSLQACD